MSASSKKKLRNEQNAAKMTERQLAEQKEAKKLKIMTVSFTAVLALILVVAISFASVQFVSNSGIREKNTVAVTIGDTKLSNAELNYYFVDAAFEFANNYGGYASMFGLDLYAPLDEQIVNEETGKTWAEDFTESAINKAKATYAICAEAEANGFTLSEDQLSEIELGKLQLTLNAQQSGYANVDDMIQAYYGPGASLDSYMEYTKMNQIAQAYYTHYAQSLTYEDADLRAAEEGKEIEFNNYSYNYYFLNVNKFLTGGTTDEEGKTTYSDEERAAAVAAAEAVAKELANGAFTSVEEFDAAIAQLEINAEAETAPKSTACDDYSYTALTAAAKDWLTDAARTEGEMGYVENATTTTNEDGTETKNINGYYVVMFRGMNDNNYPLVNVRHILVQPQGGSYNSSTGQTTYTADELAVAKIQAEELLKQWRAGDATEESFAALATEKTADPGSKETGGLYEDVYPGQMVTTFNDWCFAEGRLPGDTDIVETDYGYHIMYYVGDSETLFRDYMIKNTLISTDTEAWYTALIESVVATAENTKFLSTDLILASN